MSCGRYRGFPCLPGDATRGPMVTGEAEQGHGANKKRKSREGELEANKTIKASRSTGLRCRDIRSFMPPKNPDTAKEGSTSNSIVQWPKPRQVLTRRGSVSGSANTNTIDLTHNDSGPSLFSAPARLESSNGEPLICIGHPTGSGSGDIVRCASANCKIGLYHKSCVGLANRSRCYDTAKWRCHACRPPAPLSNSFPATSIAPIAGASPVTIAHAQMSPNGPEPPLHEEQVRVVQCIEQGHNVFFTGSAGTGKSTVSKASVKGLRAQGRNVDIIAPSGIAALAIGGCTIYTYAGWYPDIFKAGLEALIKKAFSKSVRQRLCRADVLVIDEISMVESDMLTRLDTIMRAVRRGWKPERGQKKPQSAHNSKLAFGGAQIVVTGDFCQLPPVKPAEFCLHCGGGRLDGTPKECKRCHRVYEDKDKWAFQSPAWEASKFKCFELKRVHRQKDAQFISILQKCRLGTALQKHEQNLLLRKKDNMVNAVKLLPQKNEVNKKNQEGLGRLPGSPLVYNCLDYFDWRNRSERELQDKGKPLNPQRPDGPMAALKDHRFEERVELKIGMLVILLVNLDLEAGLVNGSQGRVVRFERYNPDFFLFEQAPGSPARGMKRSKGSDPASDFMAVKEDQIRQFIERAPDRQWPVVEFNKGSTRTIYAHCQTTELGTEKPYSILGRTQIPLVAAWAITIHKSQGMSLDRVSVDLYNSFEKEMVYVALSRARSLEGLEVARMPKQMKHGMNREVLQFLKANVWVNGE